MVYFYRSEFISAQKIDGKAQVSLSKEGSVVQLEVCGLSTIGDQMHLKELVAEAPIIYAQAEQRKKKPSVMSSFKDYCFGNLGNTIFQLSWKTKGLDL